MTFFSFNVLSVNFLECVSMSNQECKARPKIIDVNSNEPVFYSHSIKLNKCSESCNNINDVYAKLSGPDIVRNINVRIFNLMSKINKTRRIIWQEIFKCGCRLTSSVCNSRQIWNEDKCKCDCKEDLVEKMVCGKEYAWNPSSCDCECDKSCGIEEYLDYKSCVCRKNLVDKLVEECNNVIDENKIYNETLNTISSNDCASCTLYFVFFAVLLTTSVIIGSTFVYFDWNSEKIMFDVI